jgi:hypothetical protein
MKETLRLSDNLGSFLDVVGSGDLEAMQRAGEYLQSEIDNYGRRIFDPRLLMRDAVLGSAAQYADMWARESWGISASQSFDALRAAQSGTARRNAETARGGTYAWYQTPDGRTAMRGTIPESRVSPGSHPAYREFVREVARRDPFNPPAGGRSLIGYLPPERRPLEELWTLLREVEVLQDRVRRNPTENHAASLLRLRMQTELPELLNGYPSWFVDLRGLQSIADARAALGR